jgi:hypothetical protein
MMYAEIPTVDHAVDRAGFVTVDGERVRTQPGEFLRYRSGTLLTCQCCGRQAVFHSMRVVCEPDARAGLRYFHALAGEPVGDLCGDCIERRRAEDGGG